MGARLRLKTSVAGSDPALRTSDPNLRKIFRAMQKYGLIVADNGSDMYVTGTFDTRWYNDILNPAFALLSASDFEVVALGWKPPATTLPALDSISADPNAVIGPATATGTITLASAAPAGGAPVSLSSGSAVVTLPASVTVPAGATTATFSVSTSIVTQKTATTLSATYNGVTRTTTFLVDPNIQAAATLATLSLDRTSVAGGGSAIGTVTLTAPAPAAGAVITLKSSNTNVAAVPASVTVTGGATAATFKVTTSATRRTRGATLTAMYAGASKSVAITVSQSGGGTPRNATVIH
jgi:hypothetical protein